MKNKKNYEHISFLGTIKTDTKIENIANTENISYEEIRILERIVAYKFYTKAIKKDIFTSKEIQGIIYFLGINTQSKKFLPKNRYPKA